MEFGLIGLGRMGANMVNRALATKQHRVVVWNRSKEKTDEAVKNGAIGSDSIFDLVSKLTQEKKVVWMMLPSGQVTEEAFVELLQLLRAGDILIDGANSNFLDSIRRHKMAKEKGILMLDVGVSGGVVAATRGYAMMFGGSRIAYDYVKPLVADMCQPEGFDLVSEEGGSGHYVKMVHNAIEYGMMQAIAEGFDLMSNGTFKGKLNLPKIAHLWNHGTIVDSFLMEMTENALNKSADLGYLKPFVEDNGEGRWAAVEAMEHAVPFTVNTYALHARYISRDSNSMAFRALAAMRNEFGGHAIKDVKKE